MLDDMLQQALSPLRWALALEVIGLTIIFYWPTPRG